MNSTDMRPTGSLPSCAHQPAAGAITRRPRQRGAAQVEFALLLLPLLGLILLIMDTAWVIFAQASIQEAVREGVRVGITANTISGCPTVTCSVQKTVQNYSAGFVKAANVQVTYFTNTNGSLVQATGALADLGGNILQVSVSGITIKSMGAIMRSHTSISLGATASDVIESNPNRATP